jgi:hypothetical protein
MSKTLSADFDVCSPASRAKICLVLSLLAVLAYFPSLRLPFISDDYAQIDVARHYGPASGWSALALDPLYRCRATSLVLTHWTEEIFGLNPVVFRLSSLFFHIVNVFLIFALGRWKVIGWRAAAIAAGFFAVDQAHQEAVMWYAAVHEVLVFCFAILSMHAWLLWLDSRREHFYGTSAVLFLLALFSKESAVAIVPVLVVLAVADGLGWRAALRRTLPFALMAVAYAALVFVAQADHFHFHDAGTFALSAPFWRTWLYSEFRLLWFWALAAAVALAVWRAPGQGRLLIVASAWAGFTMLPYSFLTYMPFVPSRHTYLASAGVAFIVAAAFVRLRSLSGTRPWVPAALAVLIVGQQCTYLWTKKQKQYVERAAAVEQLVVLARKVKGPLYVQCFPEGTHLAELAIQQRVGTPVIIVPEAQTPSSLQGRPDFVCWKHIEDSRR